MSEDGASVATPVSALDSEPLLRSILLDNIVPFWIARAPDPTGRGYRLNHDMEGAWNGPAPKTLVAQARTLWYFARLAAEGVEAERHLEAADGGFRFLRDHMWDARCGGFYWEVDPQGDSPTVTDKLLYGQAFAIYALSEHATVSKDPTILRLADDTFELVNRELYDSKHGGFFNAASREWDTSHRPRTSGSREIPDYKRMNSHLHLMEALTAYCAVRNHPPARDRLRELVLIMSTAVVRKTVGACTDRFERDWSPVRGPEEDRVSYGHDVENVTLLMDACGVLGMPDGPLLDLYRSLFDNALRFGYDRRRGGFFMSGRLGKRADRREKIWWVQAEGLVAALRMYLRTGEPEYEACYLRTLDWLTRNQIDWVDGDWHAIVDSRGRPQGDKASEWKSPYHNGRAVLTCLGLLADLRNRRRDTGG